MIHIIGAGSMGCLWAAHLNQVTFVSTKPQIPPNVSFQLTRSFSSQPATPFSFDLESAEINSEIDILLVCTKSFDAKPAIEHLQKRITPNTKILLLQNGLGSQINILETIQDSPIFGVVTTEGANFSSAHQLVHAGQGTTYWGPLNPLANTEATISAIKTAFNNGTLPTNFTENIWEKLWTKLAINCSINPFTAILNCKNGDIEKNSFFKDLWPDLKQELATLTKLAGYPTSKSDIEKSVFEVMDKTSENISSMLQDIRNNKQTEIYDINGFAAAFLAKHGMENTVNALLTERTSKMRSI